MAKPLDREIPSVSANDPANHARLSGGELTLRAILLGGLITMLFTAANVYLGLKVGLTFATSIPAAVVSIAVLRHFRGSNILENNIVQTIASPGGTLARSEEHTSELQTLMRISSGVLCLKIKNSTHTNPVQSKQTAD